MADFHFHYDAATDAVYQNGIKVEGLWKQDVYLLERLVSSACDSRFEYEGREVRFDGTSWVITLQGPNTVVFRASSPGQALRWLIYGEG